MYRTHRTASPNSRKSALLEEVAPHAALSPVAHGFFHAQSRCFRLVIGNATRPELLIPLNILREHPEVRKRLTTRSALDASDSAQTISRSFVEVFTTASAVRRGRSEQDIGRVTDCNAPRIAVGWSIHTLPKGRRMSSQRSLSDFLARLPAILGGISRALIRAILELPRAVSRWFEELARKLWRIYYQIESGIVQVITNLALSIWTLRLLAGLVLIACALAYFRWWLAFAIYIAVIGVALLLYFKMSPEDEAKAAAAQRPMKQWMETALRWTVRACMALVSSALMLVWGDFGRISQSTLASIGSTISGIASPSKPPTSQVIQKPRIAGSSMVVAPPAALDASHPATSQPPSPEQVKRPSSSDVARTVEPSALAVLSLTESASREEIETSAKLATRTFDFSLYKQDRNRKEARRLNDLAIQDQKAENWKSAYEQQRRAIEADPLDVEVAGNLALYAFRVGRTDEARELALYAMALPRPAEKTGRTADWMTLAATFAARGDAEKARAAMLVTLAISTDVQKRCAGAVQAVKQSYGDVLKPATVAMFERIQAHRLSDSPNCALPIRWESQ